MFEKKRRGSVTIFSALALMLTASFLFALLEAGRVYGLNTYADMLTELSMEAVFAEYQPGLWDTYELLALDGAYGGESFSMDRVTGVLRQRAEKNLRKQSGNFLFKLRLEQLVPEEYLMLTDGEGNVFLHQVSEYMKQNLPLELAESIYERYLNGKNIEDKQDEEDSVANAQNAIEAAKEEQLLEDNVAADEMEQGKPEVSGKPDISDADDVPDNPLELVLELKKNAILGMTVGDPEKISSKKICSDSCLLERKCEKGTMSCDMDINWYDRILVLEYLDKYFYNYEKPKEDHALSYEMEYVLCGRKEDRDNLEGMVNRLLLVREASNVIHIVSDAEKRNQAFLMAEALAGFTGNPAIVKVVQIGIMAAWAYLESILDVRALLQGDKIALVKNREQWTLQMGYVLESFQNTVKAKNCQDGLTYGDYLKQFLFFTSDKEIAYRMMDIMEQNIRLIPACQNCRMDQMICQMTYRIQYGADSCFSRLSVIGHSSDSSYLFWNRKNISYDVG